MTGRTHAVTVIPRLEIGRDRRRVLAPLGASVAAIVAASLPDLPAERREWVRVSIGDVIVPPHMWARVRPKAGAPVVIRLAPAGSALRQVLMIAVAVAALAVGQVWVGPSMAGTFGWSATTWSAIGSAATMVAGSLLVNALVPMPGPSKDKTRYAISGAQNSLSPDAPLPLALGAIRFAPPYAALPYTEEVGDEEQYFYGLFVVGAGRHAISDIRIGDTPIGDYKGVEIDIREGLPTDAPLQLITRQVVEDAMQVEISHTDGPVRRVSGGDAAELSVAVRFPAGLIKITSKGKKQSLTVDLRIRCRLAGTATWSDVTTLSVTRKTSREFRVAHRWTVAARGRYEVEVERLTEDNYDSDNQQSRCMLAALRTFRPEYPLNMGGQPLAMFAVRILASRQLQGMLDNLSALVSPIIPDWDATSGQWIARATRNPASIARYLHQGPHAAYPLPDERLDLAGMQDWHAYCAANGLFYDGVVIEETRLRETLADVCAAGRARPLDRGDRWGVVIDRPVDVVTAVISRRNARDIAWSPHYVRTPDAVRVRFQDRSNDYKSAERLVPWVGFSGDPQVVEEWTMPGLTDADAIWRAVRRRMHELTLRPYPYTAVQDVEHLAVEPGDRVALSHDYLAAEAVAAAVRETRGATLLLDAPVTMSEGHTYRARIRAADGAMRIADVIARPGETRAITLLEELDPPAAAGDLVLFGRYAETSIDCVVSRVEPGDDWTATVTMLPHAPELDALAAAETPPAWDGRAGGAVTDARAPQAPRFASIASGYEIAGAPPGAVRVTLAPAAGDPVAARAYNLRRRLAGAPAWTTDTLSSAVVDLAYAEGASVELQAQAISWSDVLGPWSAVTPYTVLPMVAPGPTLAAFAVDRLPSGLRRYSWALSEATGPDLADQVGVFIRYRAGAWASWDDLTPLHSGPLLASPYESSTPAVDGLYTFAARAVDVDGAQGPAVFVTLSTQPTAPVSIAATRRSNDIDVSVTMSVAQDSGSVRIYRSLASAAVTTEVDVSGLIPAAAGQIVAWTNAGAAAAGQPAYRYRARAENGAGVTSLPTIEALP